MPPSPTTSCLQRRGLVCRATVLALALVAAPATHGDEVTVESPTLVVTASRVLEQREKLAQPVRVLETDALLLAPGNPVDDLLRSDASFSLFRRGSSAALNPSSAGVTLRGLAPSATSRALVLLDGVPLNDPFGGWIPWASLSAEDVERVELVRGGGSGAWGNGALGGTVQLFSRSPRINEASLSAGYGSFHSRAVNVSVSRTGSFGGFRLGAGWQDSDGALVVAKPGAVDVGASNRSRRLGASWLGNTGDLKWSVSVRHAREDRGNGTRLQENGNDIDALQAGASLERGSLTWTANLYFQSASFNSTFSSVASDRSSETLTTNQYDVPSTAAGGSLTATGRAGALSYSFGGDTRWVEGESREFYSYSTATNAFLRERRGGGSQILGGVFAQASLAATKSLQVHAGVRADTVRDFDGHRRERLLSSSSWTRDDAYPAQTGGELSPNAGLSWRLSPDLRLTAAAYRAFRLPTLNERFRPFRVGNVITEANPALKTEHLLGSEAALEIGGPRHFLRLGGFLTRLDQAVTNLTLARGPGTFPLFGTLPAGTIGRQKQNVERIVVPGLEVTAEATPLPRLTLDFDYVCNFGEVRESALAPALEGKRLAEVPRHTVTAGAKWRPTALTTAQLRLRFVSAQFDDDENLLVLPQATTLDLALAQQLGAHLRLSLHLDNALDAKIVTGLPATGVESVSPGRTVRLVLKSAW